MEENTNGNKPINPTTLDTYLKGLSKREYFAAMAMQGLLSNPNISGYHAMDWISEHSVQQADSLLKTLEETKK